MTSGIPIHTLKDFRVCLYATKECVARWAKRATNGTADVAVIYKQVTFNAAYKAPPTLRLLKRINIFRGKAILSLIPSANILRPRGLGVRPTPRAKPRVSLLFIRRPIFAVSDAGALTTLESPNPPTRKCVGWKFTQAFAATNHIGIMPRETDMRTLDVPCHADVLLKLANQ